MKYNIVTNAIMLSRRHFNRGEGAVHKVLVNIVVGKQGGYYSDSGLIVTMAVSVVQVSVGLKVAINEGAGRRHAILLEGAPHEPLEHFASNRSRPEP